jgi:hypothetical protein
MQAARGAYSEASLAGRGARLRAFRHEGYLAGWRSVRGPTDLPANIPASPVKVPTTAYMVGMARGIRDAAVWAG